ncbi:MAG: cytochrome d ubiquinol oxidase subunit II [Selenomonadaceae bacterium]|nr:cytochrome d ubiquinol oxidase subunit II [Selenomonadaceae bacterium]
MEFLNVIWFILIMVLFTGFFILEGFDYGVGTLLIGKNDYERSMMIRSIGPVWDGNEVWMITAGGAMFAAFPHVYATMFSTFYLALFLMLVALIFRGVAFELRGKHPSKDWRCIWDCAITFGSLVPAILWGVAITNLLQGLPIDSQMHYLGNFFDLLSPYTILGGVTFALVFAFHGASFLTLKMADESMRLMFKRQGLCIGVFATIIYVLFIAMTAVSTDITSKITWIAPFAVSAVCFVNAWIAMKRGRELSSFIFSSMSIAGMVIGVFAGMFPRLMVSSLNPEWSLDIFNAASTPHTLAIMTGAAVVLVPIVLIYQGWTYKIFKARITPNDLNH